MITLSPKFHKCPYTGHPANLIIIEDEVNPDSLRFFISTPAVDKFYGNLHYRLLVKIPVEIRCKELMDQLAKLDNPLYLILKESSGADVGQRVKFAQEIINLCMPAAIKTVAMGAIQQYQESKTVKKLTEINEKLWDLFIENTNQRLSLKKKKFRTVCAMDKEKINAIYKFFFQLVENLYKDFEKTFLSEKKKNALKSESIKKVKDPFVEEPRAFEPAQNRTKFISKVKTAKATFPVQSPYATSYGSNNFYEKKSYEYEIPKSVPDLGFNHFRELAKIQKSDFSLNLDFSTNAQNVTNTTFFTLLETLPKFDSLKILLINISGSQNFGAVGFGYLRAGLLKTKLESLIIRADGCQPMNDACVDNVVKGLENSPKLTSFSLFAPRCPALTENSLISVSRLAKNHKSLKRLAINFSENTSITDDSLRVLKDVLADLGTLSHLELNFDKCPNISKNAKEKIRFFIRGCPNIGSYKLA